MRESALKPGFHGDTGVGDMGVGSGAVEIGGTTGVTGAGIATPPPSVGDGFDWGGFDGSVVGFETAEKEVSPFRSSEV
jgi:hypothetical protein